MTDTRYRNAIRTISLKELGREPDSVERMTYGICNEVYGVAVGNREYVFRLNQEPRFMLGSQKHIPLFRSLGINVPEILAEDYSKSDVPFAFQVQKRIPGRDLGDTIANLSNDELQAVAGEVANVFRRLSTVPNDGRFGVVWGDDRDLLSSWSAEVARVTQVVRDWGRQTGVLNERLSEILDELNRDYKSYFDRIKPYSYFGDIAGKNVMVHEGRFSGLVDLDSLAQGDPLEAIGRIKSSWYGTRHGEIYANAVMDALGLPEPQRKLVTMHALLNKIFWTLENGVQFNNNTSRVVDRDEERRDKATVEALYAELKGEPVREAAIPVAVETPMVPIPSEERQAEPEIIDGCSRSEIDESSFDPEDTIPYLDEAAAGESSDEETDVIEPVAEFSNRSMELDMGPPVEDANFLIDEMPVPVSEPLRSFEEESSLQDPDLGKRPQIEPDRITSESIVANPEPPLIVEESRSSTHRSEARMVLEASGLSKTYASDGVAFNALRSVDLKIVRGDCLAIVGKSGSGKSTLMHLLACLDGPSGGYVYVDGGDTTTMSEAEKNRVRNEKFGFVFQQFFLNGRDSVFENVVLPMRIRGASDFDITTAADEALAAVGLADKAENRAKDLSGGEKQKVCIARALVGNPEVIFADEPTGNLDSNTGDAIEKLLFDLNRSKGITLIVVTHDPELAQRFDRVVEMKDGRIINEYRGVNVRKLAAGH